MNQLFLNAVPVLEKLEQAGYAAYFVGGSVRDQLLGKDIADVDIATSAMPLEVKQIFPKTVDVGIEHGTVAVLFGGSQYEVTTFRTEAEYDDFRRPSAVNFVRSLEEDLQRRDFTMNAIAMDKAGKITDPFGGENSIRNKEIKTVGKAEERFSEDALRMLRALRFYSQLDFQIEQLTWQALIDKGYLLEHIAVERKLTEMNKLLIGKSRCKALQAIAATKMYRYLPGIEKSGYRLEAFHQFNVETLSAEEMWAILLHYLQIEETGGFLKQWKMSGKMMKTITSMKQWLDFRLHHEWDKYSLYQAGEEIAVSAEKLFHTVKQTSPDTASLLATYHTLPIKSKSELQVTGNDLLEWRKQPAGPWIREVLAEIEAAVINGLVENDKQLIRRWLQSCNQS